MNFDFKRFAKSIGLGQKMTYSINIDQLADGIEDAINEVFGGELTTAEWKKTEPSSIAFRGSLYGKTRGIRSLATTPVIFNKYPIWLNINTRGSRDGGYQVAELYTINTPHARDNLRLFIRKLYRLDLQIKSKNPPALLTTTPFNHMGLVESREFSGYRNFDNVFIPNETKETIKKYLDGFISKKEWYDKNTLRYHFGILLYGPPGTGKSVTVQAIADYLNADMCLIPTDGLGNLQNYLERGLGQPLSDKLRIVVVEDIDRSALFDKNFKFILSNESDENRQNWRQPMNSRGGFAQLLNYLDGTDSPENVIFVFTTNHIETLDPALIRPGRCDLKIEITSICEETLNQFMKFHFNKELHDIKIPEGLTFAYLQNELIRGASFEEMCEYIRNFKPENFKEEK